MNVSVCLSVCEHISGTTRPIVTRSLVLVTHGSVPSGGDAIRYVLPVLWMTSRFRIVGDSAFFVK